MNAVTPFLASQATETPASIFNMTIPMGNNVGRDILSRANDFLKTEVAAFEYVANAYESYDFGQLPQVDVTVGEGKNGFVMVDDKGGGMDEADLIRFWSMHANTHRREKGLNRRGYHGTGKIAFIAIAKQIRVETVKNGILNITSLSYDSVRKAADTGGEVKINVIVRNQPTDRPNGTKIVIDKLKKKFTTEDIRLLRDKIALELMLFMKGGQVSVNGIKVEPNLVTGDETREVSECGNFSISIVRNDAGHHEELGHVFYACDDIFIAREQTGKESHRFSHRVHAQVNTTKEWSDAHFTHCREQFVSESRDLKLKVSEPAPRALRDFAEARVRAFMKKLEDEDAARREEHKSELRKKLEQELSRIFSQFYTGGAGPKPRGGSRVVSGDKETVVIVVKDEKESSQAKDHKAPRGSDGKLKFDFKEYGHTAAPFVIEEKNLTVFFNTASPFLKSLSQQEDHPARRQALYDLAAEAVSMIEAKMSMTAEYAEKALEDPMLVINAVLEKQAEIMARIKNELAESYATFHIASQSV